MIKITLLMLFPIISSSVLANDYPIITTGQMHYYDNFKEIQRPDKGQLFYGQDADFNKNNMHYIVKGKVIIDKETGLIWQKSADINSDGKIDYQDKLNIYQVQEYVDKMNKINFSGFSDWRVPTIKELYSLVNFDGIDAVKPFIDVKYFDFGYGDESAGERKIDAQYLSKTFYNNEKNTKMFGVNFADGRIKGYSIKLPNRPEKKFYIKLVRGNSHYGINEFIGKDNVVMDKATGLMWSKNDSGYSMNWKDALSYVQTKNKEKYLGYNDWRLPNAKELQSIVDYDRNPDVTNSPSINSLFKLTEIINEGGVKDYPAIWTNTTHVNEYGGNSAVYINFGRSLGYMGSWIDIHGAGSQRSDPKSGKKEDFPKGRGPQGDAVRINNFVLLVRDLQ